MGLGERIKELIAEQGVAFKEKSKTIYTQCPSCGRSDKFSILKENGSCVCYRGTCDFGKRFFEEWLSMTGRMTIKEAKSMIYNWEMHKFDPSTRVELDLHGPQSKKKVNIEKLTPIIWPEFHMVKITAPESKEGLDYLLGRGITLEIAEKYGIMYTPMYRRVIFPVIMNGLCYGYQGRAIDKVLDGLKMRNNEDFKRESLVMFYDNLKGSDHAIVAEGPFDGIKFDKVGGNVDTMGKIISDKQLSLILSSGVKKIYWALDDDAANEMNKLLEKVSIPQFKLSVPQSCKDRCAKMTPPKKADYGECTFDEAAQAFKDAEPIDSSQFILYLTR